MRAFGFAAVVVFVATAAAPSDDPTAPVAKAYETDTGDFAVTNGRLPWEGPSREALFSQRLAALFARDERYGRESHSVGLLAFDPFLGRQCCGMSDLKLRIVSRAEDKAGRRGDVSGIWAAERQVRYRFGAWRLADRRHQGARFRQERRARFDRRNPEWPTPLRFGRRKVVRLAAAAVAAVGECRFAKDRAGRRRQAMYKIAFKGAADTDADAKGYGDPAFRAAFFTAGLRRAADGIDAYDLKFHELILDWDPVLSTNGFADVSNFAVCVTKSDARTAEVVASFGKGKDRAAVAYRFIRDGDAWRVDDVSSAPGATGNAVWSLRKIYDDALASRGKI